MHSVHRFFNQLQGTSKKVADASGQIAQSSGHRNVHKSGYTICFTASKLLSNYLPLLGNSRKTGTVSCQALRPKVLRVPPLFGGDASAPFALSTLGQIIMGQR